MTETLFAHWPFIASALTLNACGVVAKRWFYQMRPGRVRSFLITSMPAHPVVVGLAIGLVPGVPLSKGLVDPAAAPLYFAASGVASAWVYDLVKATAEAATRAFRRGS